MSDLFSQCQFPELPPPYDEALEEAVQFILSLTEPVGIIASGSIIRGNPQPNSDFDIHIIHSLRQRQRIQKRFAGIATELFFNPPERYSEYFESERAVGRPMTAHMLATGFVILSTDPIVNRLRAKSSQLLQLRPNPTRTQLTFMRYAAADRYENAQDMMAVDPVAASMLLGVAVYEMLHFHFLNIGRYIPRDKDLLIELDSLDADLIRTVRAFFRVTGEQRVSLARRIADKTIGVQGFFEWESPLEDA